MSRADCIRQAKPSPEERRRRGRFWRNVKTVSPRYGCVGDPPPYGYGFKDAPKDWRPWNAPPVPSNDGLSVNCCLCCTGACSVTLGVNRNDRAATAIDLEGLSRALQVSLVALSRPVTASEAENPCHCLIVPQGDQSADDVVWNWKKFVGAPWPPRLPSGGSEKEKVLVRARVWNSVFVGVYVPESAGVREVVADER